MSEEEVGTSESTSVNMEIIEKDARAFGWVSKEEFRGNETDWVDAETFVKRGKEINPILRANNERLKREMEAERQKHSKELKDLRESAEEFKKFQKEAFERKQALYERELSELKDQRKEAIREGDADLVVELEDRIEEVKVEKASAVAPTPLPVSIPEEQQVDPSLAVWLGDNKWFGGDIEATEIANGVGAAIRRQFPNLNGKAFLDKLDEKLKQRIPEVYENPNQTRSSVDSSSTRGSSSAKKQSYENLPADAKSACDRFIKQGMFKTRDEYVALYDWSN